MPIGEDVPAHLRDQASGVDNERILVHHEGDRAFAEQGAAMGVGHAQEEGVARHQTDRPFVVDDGADQKLRVLGKQIIDRPPGDPRVELRGVLQKAADRAAHVGSITWLVIGA